MLQSGVHWINSFCVIIGLYFMKFTRPMAVGETGSGKTTMLNKLIGKQLVTPRPFASTRKICRIRNDPTMFVQLLDSSGNLLEEITFESWKEMRKKLNTVVSLNETEGSVHYVDIHCPFQSVFMKGNVLLVDPPGIGESEALTNILKEILPNAVAFIFMVNVSNSGGVQEDRLIEILKTIKNAAPQMLCFNPCDVLFATNKWDLIDPEAGEDTERHSDDSSDDSNSEEHVSDKEKLWDMIVEKIENVWMDCDKEQIFKLSLQKVDTATDTQEKREFQRFTDELSQIIERYKDKRVQTHLSFLEDLVFKIEKGILARIHSVETGNTHTLTEIQKTLKKINDDSNQIESILEERIKRSKEKLGEQLHTHIHSDEGKELILNPPGENPIKDCGFSPSEIRKRLKRGVEKWVRGTPVFDEIKSIEDDLRSRLQKINLDLEKADVSLVGAKGCVKINAEDSKKWLSISIAVAVYTFFTTIMSAALKIKSQITVTDIYYKKCAEKITQFKIEEFLESILNDHFKSKIHNIFAIQIPREIRNKKYIIRNIIRENKEFSGRIQEFYRLHDQIREIKTEVDSLF